MTDKKQPKQRKINWWAIILIVLALAAIVFLMIYRLGNLMPGITYNENTLYGMRLGWHGIYHNPLNLPMKLLWSIDFKLFAPIGHFLLRLPSAITGGLTIVAYYILLQLWFGTRSAIIGTILFATSAWTLHVSRLATIDIEYLAATTFFLLLAAILQKKIKTKYIYWLINIAWGLLLYVPGMVFLIVYNIFRQRREISFGFRTQNTIISKIIYLLSAIIWLPLLIINFIRSPHTITSWLAFPNHFANIFHIIKEFGAVFYHIFIYGPLLPSLWLGRLPILDIFGIIAALAGIYFYVTHIRATRTHLIFVSIILGSLLVALGGGVSISIVMPLIYILVTTGIAYLLSQWLSIFPENPIARSVGYTLIALAITASVIYNVRSYFIAWPHNQTSISVFDVKVKD